jgi:hypothetical protein
VEILADDFVVGANQTFLLWKPLTHQLYINFELFWPVDILLIFKE